MQLKFKKNTSNNLIWSNNGNIYKNYYFILILSFVSGALDFYMIKKYSIFVTTQTGNLVYFGLSLLNGQLVDGGFVYTFHNAYLYLIPIIFLFVFSLLFSFLDNKKFSIYFIYLIFLMEIIFFVLSGFYSKKIPLYNFDNFINPIAIVIIMISTIFVSFHLTFFNKSKNIIYANVVSMGDIINASRAFGSFIVKKNNSDLLVFLKYFFIIISFVLAILLSYVVDKFSVFNIFYLIAIVIAFTMVSLFIVHVKQKPIYFEL